MQNAFVLSAFFVISSSVVMIAPRAIRYYTPRPTP